VSRLLRHRHATDTGVLVRTPGTLPLRFAIPSSTFVKQQEDKLSVNVSRAMVFRKERMRRFIDV
jgi:hypothetical protein